MNSIKETHLQLLRDLTVDEIVNVYKTEFIDEYTKARIGNKLKYLKFIPYETYNVNFNIDCILWLDKNLESEERNLFSILATKYMYLILVSFSGNAVDTGLKILPSAFIRYVFECVSEYQYAWLTNKYLSFSRRKEVIKRLREWCKNIDILIEYVSKDVDKYFYFIRYINGSELTICYE